MTFIRTALISLHLNPVIPHQPSNNLSPTTVTLQTQYNTFVHKNIHTQVIGTLLTAPCRVVVVYLAAFCDALLCKYVVYLSSFRLFHKIPTVYSIVVVAKSSPLQRLVSIAIRSVQVNRHCQSKHWPFNYISLQFDFEVRIEKTKAPLTEIRLLPLLLLSLQPLSAYLRIIPRLNVRLAKYNEKSVADEIRSGGDKEHNPPLTDVALQVTVQYY